MNRQHSLILCALLCSSVGVFAAPAATTKAAANKPSTLAEATAQRAAGQTDIIATVDTPMVTNIISWQEQESSVPKNPLEFSALKESLTPTDRDRLASEIRYTQILNKHSDQSQ